MDVTRTQLPKCPVTQAGTPRGGAQEFLAAARGGARGPARGGLARPLATAAPAARRQVTGKSPVEIPGGAAAGTTARPKRKLHSPQRRGPESAELAGAERGRETHPHPRPARAGRPWGAASARPPARLRPDPRPDSASERAARRGECRPGAGLAEPPGVGGGGRARIARARAGLRSAGAEVAAADVRVTALASSRRRQCRHLGVRLARAGGPGCFEAPFHVSVLEARAAGS